MVTLFKHWTGHFPGLSDRVSLDSHVYRGIWLGTVYMSRINVTYSQADRALPTLRQSAHCSLRNATRRHKTLNVVSAKPVCQLVVLINDWNIPEHCRVDLYYVCLCGGTPMHLLEMTRAKVKQGLVEVTD